MTFPVWTDELPSAKSQFRLEIEKAVREIAFSIQSSGIPFGNSISPAGKPESGPGNDLSCLEIRIASREIAIPVWKLKKRSRKSLFFPAFLNSDLELWISALTQAESGLTAADPGQARRLLVKKMFFRPELRRFKTICRISRLKITV
jgi:hypothetical protein